MSRSDAPSVIRSDVIWLLLAAAVPPMEAQSLRVYSEFVTVPASGDVSGQPREILSPQLVRNGFTSLQVAVRVDAGVRWTLHIGQNPEDAVRATMYRERGDRLEPARLPVEGEGAQVFWMDLWTDRGARVERIKVEPQLSIDKDWVVYPMEARVMSATVPQDFASRPGTAPPVRLLASYLCGAALPPGAGEGPLAEPRNRNARQDLALAALAPKDELLRLVGGPAWCKSLAAPGEEWYLRVRDFLLRSSRPRP